MADAIVGATVQVLLEKTLSLAIDKIGSVFGFKKDLESLRDSAKMIQAFLADAEDKQRQSPAVQLWFKKLEGVAFDAYYVLDELNYEILRRKVKSRNQLKVKVCLFFFLSKDDISFRWRMASKVRDINIQLKTINQEATDFGLIRIPASLLPITTGVTMSRQTNSLVVPNVVGRVGDESKIVNMLLSPSEKVVSVLPIVGMGGLGKTTLAKSVYNNQQVNAHFSPKIWVCVSENFEPMELFKLILESLTGNKVKLSSMDGVVQEIRKRLEGKRYLLVLDDVWNEVPALWDSFFDSLVGITTASESRCLVTTRLLNVASIVSRHPPYELGKLTDDECWSIVKAKVIEGGEIPEELSKIRMQITKRCCGLPLAANVIGGLLCLQRKDDWLSIVENRLWNENSIEQILRLSFDYLPSPSIKKCFAYCSLFEKDVEMEKNLLIELWMAEGFLQPHLQNETMLEEAGDRYLNILLQSSLLEKEDKGWATFYKMHDHVHDLAQFISKLEHIKSEDDVIKNQVRYLELQRSRETMMLNNKSALILERSSIFEEMLSKLKHLHILNLSEANIIELPSSICKLKHLRFLNLSYSEIKSLPESLCKLYNLQTLRLGGCSDLKTLPKGTSNLISLRHLHYYNDDVNFKMPSEMGRLNCLQTLQFFNVGEEKGRQIEELGCLKELKGKLKIRNLELVNDKEVAERAKLSGKPNILKLEYSWGNNNREDLNSDEHVLEGLEPHPNLQKLTIWNFMGDQFPGWLGNLPKLVKLELHGCKRCRELPVLGHLQYLEYLKFEEMENVSCIGLSFYGLDDNCSCGGGEVAVVTRRRKLFPSLKTLKLIKMSGLVEWKEAKTEAVDDDDDVFPVLEYLTIRDCSQLTATPTHFRSLRELKMSGNIEVLVVKCIVGKVTNTLQSLTLREMNEITHISEVVDLCEFKLLRSLEISGCHGIVRVSGSDTNNNQLLKSLEHLQISNCDGLMSIASETFDCCTSLRKLTVYNCPNLESFPLKLFKSLEDLEISNCDGLMSIASETFDCCTSLRKLRVYNCPNLESFPLDLRQTHSLSSIWLKGCHKLFLANNNTNTPRGFGHLTSLQFLSIGPFSHDDDSSIELFDWSGLISLPRLELSLHGLPETESLPDQLQNLTSLTSLSLKEFGSIEALPDWLGNLASLETLYLFQCEKLRYLPSMPALRRLTKLTQLEVYNCPLLKERCQKRESGPDESEWSKISQLPNLRITYY